MHCVSKSSMPKFRFLAHLCMGRNSIRAEKIIYKFKDSCNSRKYPPPPQKNYIGNELFSKILSLIDPHFYNLSNASFTFLLNCVDKNFSSTRFFPAFPYFCLRSTLSARTNIASANFFAFRFSTSIPVTPFILT